ncbi:MAG: V-type ATPase subunit [Clostridiales bacterium]|nr:V-type ATPase subunit [Clostridiales bacterium]
MISTLSSNVILAKARAMYGRRLTMENYKDLLACRNVSEVASYLKTRTVYKNALVSIDENSVHRGQLEAKLKQKLLEDYSSLCRYEITVGEHFARYLIEQSEIEQILHSLLMLQNDTPGDFALPMYITRHTQLDLAALSQVENFDDLLNALDKTPYRKLLEGFRPIAGVPLNYTGIENALYTYLYKQVFDIIKNHTHFGTRKQLYEIFTTYIDLTNYARIVRLKVSYNASPDFIRSSLLPFGNVDRKLYSDMMAANSVEEITEIMEKTSIGKRFLKIKHSYVDEIPNFAKYSISRHNIRYSTHPSVVLMSYTFLMQTELMDIITIIEGTRYKLPPDEIIKLLIIYNYKERGD